MTQSRKSNFHQGDAGQSTAVQAAPVRRARRAGKSPRSQASRAHLDGLGDFLQFMASTTTAFVVLREQARIMWLRAHPWCHELDNRLRVELHELACQEELLLRARAKLLGQRRRPIDVEPLGEIAAPSEVISAGAAGIARTLEAIL